MRKITVRPVVIGYDFSHALEFASPTGGSPSGFPDLTTAARIVGQFRATIDAVGAPLATVDTANSSLQAILAYALQFEVGKAATANFPISGVFLDFARLDGTEWTPLPVVLRWPVRLPVTRGLLDRRDNRDRLSRRIACRRHLCGRPRASDRRTSG